MKEVKAPKMEKKKKINSKFIPKPERIISASELELMELRAKKKQNNILNTVLPIVIIVLLVGSLTANAILGVNLYKEADNADYWYMTNKDNEKENTETKAKYGMCLDTLDLMEEAYFKADSTAVKIWNYWYEGYSRSTSGDNFKSMIEAEQEFYANIIGNQI